MGGFFMTNQRLLAVLTLFNLALLVFTLGQQLRPANAVGKLPVLRGSALEIVDGSGKVRASISVFPEDPKTLWKGKPYPETVLLRLMTADGSPGVKIGAAKSNSGVLVGDTVTQSYIQVEVEDGAATLKQVDKDGHVRVTKP
jgi:hypothetical protein